MTHEATDDPPEEVPELAPYDEDELDQNPILNPNPGTGNAGH